MPTAPILTSKPASWSIPARSLEYFDPETNEKYIPYVIEPSLGADRVALAFLCDAYDEEEVGEKRYPRGAASASRACALIRPACCRLSKKLAEQADEIYTELAKAFYGGL